MARRIHIRRVVDGDSLVVNYGGLFGCLRRPFPVRLYGIDAPELAQPCGREAQRQLASLAGRGHVRMDVMGADRYGRTVGLLYAGSGTRESVNVAMVRAGMAYWYRQYGGRELGFPEAEAEARTKRRGVWRDGRDPPRPWDYRAAQRRARPRRRWPRRPLIRLASATVVLITLVILALVARTLD